MKNLAIFISYLIPVFIREKILTLFSLTLGKGFDFQSLNQEVNLFKKLIKNENSLFLDIGANKGKYTDILIKEFPTSKVYVFEPQKNLFKFLKKKYSKNNNIKLFNIAINHENKKIKLNVRFKGDPLGSLYKRKFLKNRLRKIEIVKCQRLDKILDINQVIDFAKIDTEGNEMNVLNGIGKLIYNFKIIQIEFGGTWIDSRFFYRDLYEFFKDKNFFLYRMSPNKLIKIIEYNEKDEYFTFTNFIAINNNYVFTTTKSKNKVKSK
jgi:FkbM family methyltransferase